MDSWCYILKNFNFLFLYFLNASGTFPEDFVPTVFDNYSGSIPVQKFKSVSAQLELWDTACIDDYDRLRLLSYPETSVVLLAFSLVSRESFNNVKTKWIPELKEHIKNVPIVLVGTKLDLRDDENLVEELKKRGECPVTRKQGEKMANDIKAAGYFECSAKTQKGLKEVFFDAMKVVVDEFQKDETEGEHSRCFNNCAIF